MGDLETAQNFVDYHGITFTMLWSESPQPTDYYQTITGVWSSVWLLDSTGDRVLSVNRFHGAVLEYLLAEYL